MGRLLDGEFASLNLLPPTSDFVRRQWRRDALLGWEFASLHFSSWRWALLDWEFASLLLSLPSLCLTWRWWRIGGGALCRKGV